MPNVERRVMRTSKFAALMGLIVLGGCAEAVSRDDFIEPALGDAVAANRAIQTINPWPRESFSTAPRADGPNVATTIQRYRGVGGASAPAGGSAAAQSSSTQ